MCDNPARRAAIGGVMRGKRVRIILVAVVVVLAVAAWVPVPIAELRGRARGAEIGRARLDRGWEFVYQAVRQWGARLGDDDLALKAARQVWAGPPALAQSRSTSSPHGRPLRCRSPRAASSRPRASACDAAVAAGLGRGGNGVRRPNSARRA